METEPLNQLPGPSNSGKFLGVLGDPYDLPNSSGLAHLGPGKDNWKPKA